MKFFQLMCVPGQKRTWSNLTELKVGAHEQHRGNTPILECLGIQNEILQKDVLDGLRVSFLNQLLNFFRADVLSGG